jgi:TATA-box binding protein (TBP) (component of TFIID and TFIIIB)
MLDIKLTQVCSNKSEFIAETTTKKNIDLESMNNRARSSQLFENVTYLRSIGVLRFKFSGKSILFFRNGRITINCVKNLHEASLVIRSIVENLGLE